MNTMASSRSDTEPKTRLRFKHASKRKRDVHPPPQSSVASNLTSLNNSPDSDQHGQSPYSHDPPPERPHRRPLSHSPNRHSPSPSYSADDTFRTSLFDALQDDEAADFWQNVYGQPLHTHPDPGVPNPTTGILERMSDEEYAAYVRREMYKQSQEYIDAERERRRRERERARRREEREREGERVRRRRRRRGGDEESSSSDDDDDDGRRGRKRRDWDPDDLNDLRDMFSRSRRARGADATSRVDDEDGRVWARYEAAWKSLRSQSQTTKPPISNAKSSTAAEQLEWDVKKAIFWPHASGSWRAVKKLYDADFDHNKTQRGGGGEAFKDGIERFFRRYGRSAAAAAASGTSHTGKGSRDGKGNMVDILKSERVRWHPDKVQRVLGVGQVDEEVMRVVTAIFQVVDALFLDAKGEATAGGR